jgi:hypothetical protein
VQKVLNTFPEETKRQFILDEVYHCLIDLAKDSNGLCVIKRLIQLYSPASLDKVQPQDQVALRKKNALAILVKIQESVIDLVQDPFGNYAVSEIIKTWDINFCRPIFSAIKTKLCTLSNQKFSSNVIELCLGAADEEMRNELIREIRCSEKLTSLIRNQFGNYVVQRTLKVATGAEKELLMNTIY